MISGIRVVGVVTAAIVLSIVSEQARADLKGNLTIEVENLRSQKGEVCLRVFSSANGFPGGQEGIVKQQCVKIQQTPLTVQFTNLKNGSYAIAAFHDSNSDRQLNRNALGIPTEDFGFSRNPQILTGPPRFGDAAFMLAGPRTTLKIRMQSVVGG